MVLAFVWNLKNVWPFSMFKPDDLRVSNDFVSKLSIPEETKQFVYAVREPETQSLIYILSVQNLSERSVSDAECLIGEIRPELVIAQVGHSPTTEDRELGDGVDSLLPTSSFEVLRRCFLDKVSKENYENVASNLVLREIFGTSFHGNFLAAKKAALEVGSSFLEIESKCLNSSIADNSTSEDLDAVSKYQGLVSSLVPQKVGIPVSSSSMRLFSTNNIQSQMVQLLAPYMDLSIKRLSPSSSVLEIAPEEIQLQHNYEAPPFAQSIYSLLVDLYNIFEDIPSIGKALAHSQKMLYSINRGEAVDNQIISEVYIFRVAVEGLRIAMNNAGRLPIDKLGNANSSVTDFSELSIEDKSQVLFIQALRDQAKKFKTIVAVVDASNLAGLRKHWNVHVPPEVKDLVGQIITDSEGEEEMSKQMGMKRLLTEKPMVAVGAGATAVIGATSLSKVVPASTIMKAVTFKVPASLKLMMTQSQKVVALAKTFVPSKVVAPGFATSGIKTTPVLKATASAENIRAVAHGVIASAEKTSFSAMRTAFYEIMRKRQVRPIGFLPWATFGGSIATCMGLLMYGDGIECVAESLPAAPSIANLGRGVHSLHQVSQELRQTDGTRIQKSVESLMYRLKKVKFQ
ncbi:hypothetical protein FEM48_ZijujUnG0054500 [Ziziphus jujuba var. spinosa]|uniref:Transmembrane protein n=1 Tax=Ziziphus jujuba var. spinosa TaxID=714518 RepID=A0A978U983_ZIZJJ|nr:uncharacterized protein LOC125420304 [Ziziphus jujuba var. spinosa]KAH7510742.1 hypothetical protein FEM48_ZijujUnG0097700 [Ziziphus jujuba var. spinosa]KAH7511092.1 hypothetical protein FEM48_ZijujUnG0054500 [Ziziphus jujuba var. spinosa]